MQILTSRITLGWRLQLPVALLALSMIGGGLRAQDAEADTRRQRFDAILDANVRDGFVYYHALKSERSRLDGFITSLANVRSTPRRRRSRWRSG